MNPGTALLIDLAVLALLMYRQLKVRPLGDGRFTAVLLVLGVVEFVSWTGQHRVTGVVLVYLVASLVASAVLGAVRAVTVRVWRRDGQVFRQGTWVTALLWLVSAGGHVLAGMLLHGSEAAAASATTLLFLGATLGIQQLVLRARAATLPASGGDLAGAFR
jgi:hypothetical protein